jgi:hypothetical protein
MPIVTNLLSNILHTTPFVLTSDVNVTPKLIKHLVSLMAYTQWLPNHPIINLQTCK